MQSNAIVSRGSNYKGSCCMFVDEATKELYNECTRLEREIFQYKSRNQKMKNLLCKLSIDYENAKGHALHLWGRYKELKQMIVEVINSDI